MENITGEKERKRLMCNHCIPLENIDNRVKKGKYILHRTGGYHKFHKVSGADPIYKKPHFPWIEKILGRHSKKPQTLWGCLSTKKPYIYITVDGGENQPWSWHTSRGKRIRRRQRVKIYFHRIIAIAYVPNPKAHFEGPDKADIVHHINEKPADYRVENLEWRTKSGNSIGYPKSKRRSMDVIYYFFKDNKWA